MRHSKDRVAVFMHSSPAVRSCPGSILQLGFACHTLTAAAGKASELSPDDVLKHLLVEAELGDKLDTSKNPCASGGLMIH
jgi:hypothetical protein